MNEYRWKTWTWMRFFFLLHNTIPSFLKFHQPRKVSPSYSCMCFQQLYNNISGPCRLETAAENFYLCPTFSRWLFVLLSEQTRGPRIQDLNNSRQSVTLPSPIAVMLEMTAKRPPSPSFITSTEPWSTDWADSSGSSHIYLAGAGVEEEIALLTWLTRSG